MSEGIITLSLLDKNNYIDFVQDAEQQRYIERVKDILKEKYCNNIPKHMFGHMAASKTYQTANVLKVCLLKWDMR